jgi:ribonuclease BN (tRNA processing enzyme)
MSRPEVYTIENTHFIFEINSKKWFLKGWSRAGLKTGFILYHFKILFDCVIYTSSKPDIIFLTHQHTDHTQAIAHICSRHKPNITKIYLPEPSIKYITKYERVISELSNPLSENLTDEEILAQQNIKLIPANPFDIFNLNITGQELQVEVIKAYHDVQSNGYGFSTWVKQIKPEYADLIKELDENEKNLLSAEEIKSIKQDKINKIKELKSKQIELYTKTLNPEFVFYCDSTIENLTNHSEWKKYPVIICECTGLDPKPKQNSDDRDYDQNHTSILTLKPIMLDNKDKKWLLIHISQSCSEEKIKQIECELIAEGLNVSICF